MMYWYQLGRAWSAWPLEYRLALIVALIAGLLVGIPLIIWPAGSSLGYT
jgi:hypothetical protein